MAMPPYLLPAIAAAGVLGLVLYQRRARAQEADDFSEDFAPPRPGDIPLPARGGPLFQDWDCADWIYEKNLARHRLEAALAEPAGTPGREQEVKLATLQDETADLAIQALGGCGLKKKLVDFGEA